MYGSKEFHIVLFETDCLIIRNFTSGDASDLFDYIYRPSARCFFSLAVADLQAAEAEAAKRGSNDDYLAVCLKSNGQVIGDFFARTDLSDHMDQSDTFSVGWNINPHFGKAGYTLDAAKGPFRNLFTERLARRLDAYVDEGNFASETLCEAWHASGRIFPRVRILRQK